MSPQTAAESDMFRIYTSRAKRVVVVAQEEARRLKHGHISPDHILLGVLGECADSPGESLAIKILKSVDVDISSLRRSTLGAVGEGAYTRQGHIPFTRQTKKVLEDTFRESLLLGHNHTGPEHILLGLLREGSSAVANFPPLGETGLDAVRREVLRREDLVGSVATRALTRARMSALDIHRRPDDIDLLVALLDEIGESKQAEPEVVEVLSEFQGHIPMSVRSLGTRPLRDVISAPGGENPDVGQLVAALAKDPSPAYKAVLAAAFPFAGIEFGEPVQTAFRLAVSELGPDQVLGTGPLLAALDRTDTGGRWDRVWFRLDRGDSTPLAVVPDPDVEPRLPAPPDARWRGVPLSPALAASLALLKEMVTAYDMDPVPPGGMALALMSEPTSGAVRTLLAGTELSQIDLFEIVQDELLGTHLKDFAPGTAQRWRPTGGPVERAVQRAEASAIMDHRVVPDDLDLIHGVVQEIGEETVTFASMLAQVPGEVVEKARMLGGRTAMEVRAAHPEVAGEGGDEWQLVAACVDPPSSACAAMLRVAGLTGPGVAADALVEREERAGRISRISRQLAITMAGKAAVMLIAPLLVVFDVFSTGRWWNLLLVVPVMACPPFAPVATTLVVAIASAVLVAPVNGVVGVVLAALGLLDSRLQRRRLMARVAVSLTSSEYTSHLARQRPFAARRIVANAHWRVPSRQRRLQRRVERLEGSTR